MTDNLAYALSANSTRIGSKNDGSTFTFNTGASYSADQNAIMNRNTKLYNGQWFYNWFAATAGRGNASSTGDIDGSICPAHWKLPYEYGYQSNRSFGGLLDAYTIPYSTVGVTLLKAFPFSLKIYGVMCEGTTGTYPTYSNYWQSTVYRAGNAYELSIAGPDNKRVSPSGHDDENAFGFHVRCVAL